MKRILSVVLVITLIIANILSAGAFDAKTQNDTSPRGADSFAFTGVTYDSETGRISGGKFLTGLNNWSTNQDNYHLMTTFVVHIPNGTEQGYRLIVPILGVNGQNYFGSFQYKVGDGALTSVSPTNGPITGVSNSSKYLASYLFPLINLSSLRAKL